MPAVRDQFILGFVSPGPPLSEAEALWRAKHLRKVEAVPVVKTLWVHKSVLSVMGALVLFLQRDGNGLGERVDDWGFANRDIRGFPGSKSYHAWGLAIDVDATENPMGVRNTSFLHRARVRRVCALLGLRWGLDYSGRPDAMHFEFTGSRARARWLRSRLTKPTRRSRELARLCGLDVHEFIRRIK